MIKKILLGIGLIVAMMIMLTTMVSAIEWENTCENGDLVSRTQIISDGSTYREYNINQTITCEYGCDNVTRTCMVPQYQANLIVIILALISMGLVAFLLKKIF